MAGGWDSAPPAAFHFAVTFGTQPKDADGSFREVSGIGPEMQTETVVEGGENRFVHVLPKGVKHPRLVLWCQAVLEGGLVKPVFPKLVHVFLLDGAGQALRVWSFDSAWPVKWDVEPFGSTKNELALEKIELSYAFSKREV
jgi:phage tail-like protein